MFRIFLQCGIITLETRAAPPTFGYFTLFEDLLGVYDRHMDHNCIENESVSALWCLKMAHQMKTHPTESGHLLLTDSF